MPIKRDPNDPKIAEVARLYRQMPARAVAAELEMSEATVKAIARDLGIRKVGPDVPPKRYRIGIRRGRSSSAVDMSQANEDWHSAEKASDRLLALLKEHHPDGYASVTPSKADGIPMRFYAGPVRSSVGSSAGMCADF